MEPCVPTLKFNALFINAPLPLSLPLPSLSPPPPSPPPSPFIFSILLAQGTLKSDSAGLVAGLAEKASELKLGMGADDLPVVVLEFDTG